MGISRDSMGCMGRGSEGGRACRSHFDYCRSRKDATERILNHFHPLVSPQLVVRLVTYHVIVHCAAERPLFRLGHRNPQIFEPNPAPFRRVY